MHQKRCIACSAKLTNYMFSYLFQCLPLTSQLKLKALPEKILEKLKMQELFTDLDIVVTGQILNVHKTLIRHPGRFSS